MMTKTQTIILLMLMLLSGIVALQNNFNTTISSENHTKLVSPPAIVIENAPGTIIENQILTGNITLKNSPNSIIRNNIVSGASTYYGIYVENSDNTIIENNIIKDMHYDSDIPSYGLFVTISTNVTVRDNQLTTLTSGTSVSAIGINGSIGTNVVNNSVDNINNDKGSYGILDTYGNNDTIVGNNLSNLNSSYSSVGVYEFFGQAITIKNNTISTINNQAVTCCFISEGILILYGQNSTITENKISSITASASAFNYGIYNRYSNYSIIEMNYLEGITSTADHGETIGIFSDTSNNTKINNNVLLDIISTYDVSIGIASQLGHNNSITNNILSDLQSKLKSTRGIYFIYEPSIIVENNTLQNITAQTILNGIYGTSSNNFKVKNNSISNLATPGKVQPYLFSKSNGTTISVSQINKISIQPNSLGSTNFELLNNGSLVQSGLSDYSYGVSLDYTNITGTYNNITLIFIGTSTNETYQFTLIKPLTPNHSISQPTIYLPQNNTELLIKTDLLLEWSPSVDSFNNMVRYTIYYSNDSMNTWNMIAQDLVNNSYSFSLTNYNLLHNITINIKLMAYDNEVHEIENSSIFTYQLTYIIAPPEPTTTTITTTISTTTPTTTPGSTTSTTTTPSEHTNTTNTSGQSTSVNDLSILLALGMLSVLLVRKRRRNL